MGWKNDLGLILFGGMILSFTNFVLVSNILLQGVNKKQENSELRGEPLSYESIADSISIDDLIASVFWQTESSEDLTRKIISEQEKGLRDKYFLPSTYVSRLNNSHFDDSSFADEHQKEVYMLARQILVKMSNIKENVGKKLTAIDIGCGSGWKLVHFLSKQFKTIGIETEPALTHLRKTYPNQTWLPSGKEEESLPENPLLGECDVGISSDVIEHIRDPDTLLKYLKNLKCQLYVMSTPKREFTEKEGPPRNPHHVREWTFHEFQVYLKSRGFVILKSYDGLTTQTARMHVIRNL